MKTDANMARVAAVVKDCWVGIQMTEEKIEISKIIVQRTLHNNLKKWKICARFVPYAPTAKQGVTRELHTRAMSWKW